MDQQQEKKKSWVTVKRLQGSPILISLSEPLLGKGQFGEVRKAYMENDNSQELAVKIIKKRNMTASIKQEVAVLQKLEYNPNLVNFIRIEIESDSNFYFLMEYCNEKTLTHYLKQQKIDLSDEEIYDFIFQFSNGYKTLYNSKILHCDIKLDNILRHNGQYKIADFGLSKILERNYTIDDLHGGTPITMSPEAFFDWKMELTANVDMFSFGVVIFQMMYLNSLHPYVPSNKPELFNKQFRENQEPQFPQTPARDPALIQLVRSMLAKDSKQRLTWDELYNLEIIREKHQSKELERLQMSTKLSKKSLSDGKLFRELESSTITSRPANPKLVEYQVKNGSELFYEFDNQILERKRQLDDEIRALEQNIIAKRQQPILFDHTVGLCTLVLSQLTQESLQLQFLKTMEILKRACHERLNDLLEFLFLSEKQILNDEPSHIMIKKIIYFQDIISKERDEAKNELKEIEKSFAQLKDKIYSSGGYFAGFFKKKPSDPTIKEEKEALLAFISFHSHYKANLEKLTNIDENVRQNTINKLLQAVYFVIRSIQILEPSVYNSSNENILFLEQENGVLRIHDHIIKLSIKEIEDIVNKFKDQFDFGRIDMCTDI